MSNLDLTSVQETEPTKSISTPDELFRFLMYEFKLKNYAHLARIIGTSSPAISKVKHKMLVVTPTLILRIHDRFGLPVKRIRELANLPQVESYIPVDKP